LDICGEETPIPVATKFYVTSDNREVITHANFGEVQLLGFGMARSQILAFSIDLLRRH